MAASEPDGRTLRGERRRADTRRRLLEALESMLAGGRPYDEISVGDVAAEAGLSRPMFYTYFDDKGALLNEWFEGVALEVGAGASEWWKLESGATVDDLRAAVTHMVEALRPRTPMLAALDAAATQDAAVREQRDGLLAGSIAGLGDHVRRGQDQGWIPADLPSEETAGWLTCLAESGQRRVAEADEKELELLTAAAVDVIWRALYAPLAD